MPDENTIENNQSENNLDGEANSQELDFRAEADNSIGEIEAQVSGVPAIPYHLVEKHFNKTTKLLSNSGEDVEIQAKNRWHEYEFSEPLFIAFIDIQGINIDDTDEYEFRIGLSDGQRKRFLARPKSGSLRVDVNEFCTSIGFKPPSIFWSIWRRKPELQRVNIWGFYKENLGEFLYKISRVSRIKNEAIDAINEVKDETDSAIETLAAKQTKLADINTEISDANGSISALNTSIAEKEAVDSELQSKIDRAEVQLETINEQVSTRRTELQTTIQSRENAKAEFNKAETDLKKLKDDINLFPSEISGFVDQAGQDLRTYTEFTVGLIAIICILFIWVLTGAFDLSEYVKENPEQSVWPLLFAKLPLAIAVSALVAAAYKIARVFIEELLKINRQKLSLTQVSIIAKDVSQAAEHDLKLTETQTYGLRLRVKMAMLSDHIGTFVPGDPNKLLPQNIFDPLSSEREEVADQEGDDHDLDGASNDLRIDGEEPTSAESDSGPAG